ncbi:MAG: glutathione S-transferase N-terminal domain-containing protein [Alphaproteobacteria bacterium]|nr:glutathione S-transferase N-terminal domain-containing protein [Alphaproteobacteria bacterium]
MIDFYTWTTPNGRKISIMLEECGLAYTVHPVNITMNQQFEPNFLKISPNNKIPAIVDRETGSTVFESGAILIYLAEKTGRFLAKSGDARWKAIEWLMWQMAGLGPMAGQLGHFSLFAKEKIPYAIDRYANEVARLMGVLEKRLIEAEYLAGEDYSIADMAAYPWVSAVMPNLAKNFKGLVKEHGHIDKWLKHIADRPAVQRGMNVPPAH